ncbi:chorismate mutase [Neisseria leonii]|uniref:chorismate mutase n=1 Tax=Neisseria leonii TaxID=2995413 RepID=UPI00237C21E2|nr:chorismate mutase [Neisseria sp. 3986]MDD9325282.1 chorismate mutase [Neisseria sp. 3986]
MIIVMQKYADEAAVAAVVALIRSRGLQEHISRGEERTIIGAVGDERILQPQEAAALPQVERAIRVLDDWRIVSREAQPEDSVIHVRGVAFGGEKCVRIGVRTADMAAFDALYGDPFFVDNHPYADNGRISEKEQIRAMRETVAACHGAEKPVLVRIRDVRQIAHALQAEADVLYLGGELMTNRALQEEVGRLNTPLVLCKDKHHTYRQWLVAAEQIALKGNAQIILGEAGTLSFTAEYPHRLDVEAVVQVRRLSHLPVLANLRGLQHSAMPSAVLHKLALAAGVHAVVLD